MVSLALTDFIRYANDTIWFAASLMVCIVVYRGVTCRGFFLSCDIVSWQNLCIVTSLVWREGGRERGCWERAWRESSSERGCWERVWRAGSSEGGCWERVWRAEEKKERLWAMAHCNLFPLSRNCQNIHLNYRTRALHCTAHADIYVNEPDNVRSE